VLRSSSRPASDPEKLPLINFEAETPTITLAEQKRRHREQYAIEQEEREVEEGIRDNPSLDVVTQKAIIDDYRTLHQQFKDEGLYQCRYSEYGKESIRYGLLFIAFGYFLYIKWYMTSAVFLGLFWVSQLVPLLYAIAANTITATNHVHSTRCRPPRHHRKLRRRHPHRCIHRGLLLRP
jgi:delta8-fatty-acid desaturase